MTLKNCSRCEGSKKVIGMGCMKEDCPQCKGVGKVLDEKVEKIEKEEKPEKVDMNSSEAKTRNDFRKIASGK